MIVQSENLYKTYGRHEALLGLNLSVPEGSAFALIGANGAGKTTTIKVLMNILRPSRGMASVLGMDSRRLSHRELATIGYVSENQIMPSRLTVGAYLDYLRPFYATWDRDLEHSILAQLRLPIARRIGELSHGMRLKMALACALPFRPKLLILDEPFSGLDPLVREEFMERLLQQAGEMTILISSHELSEIEGVATHIAYLEQGQLLFQDAMADLNNRSRSVRITLQHEPAPLQSLPDGWLQPTVAGNVLSFVHTQFSEADLASQLGGVLTGIRQVDVRPIGLRQLFVALARAAQDKGAAA